jgi:hypothetical protein
VLKAKYLTQVFQDRSGHQTRQPSQKRAKEAKKYQPAQKGKGVEKKLLLEGKDTTKGKEKTPCTSCGQSCAEDWIQSVWCKEWAHDNCVELELIANKQVRNFPKRYVRDCSSII